MKKVYLMLVIASICCFSGCGHKEELVNTTNVTSLAEDISEELEHMEAIPEEGYIYDYQVSLEPIPEFIAQMGGEQCGTMHTSPGAIQLMYTTFLVGMNEEWMTECEVDKEVIQEYLLNTYGKEFRILPYYKGLAYIYSEENSNDVYMLYLLESDGKKVVTTDSRDYEENGKKYGEELVEVLENNIQGEYVYKLYCENSGPASVLHIDVAMFREEKPDYIQEQNIAISIYEKMKQIQAEQNNELFLIAFELLYYPMEYQEIITAQYNSTFLYDVLWSDDEKVKKLIEMNEIYASFDFSTLFKDETAFKELVENKDVYFENEYMLPYWR